MPGPMQGWQGYHFSNFTTKWTPLEEAMFFVPSTDARRSAPSVSAGAGTLYAEPDVPYLSHVLANNNKVPPSLLVHAQ